MNGFPILSTTLLVPLLGAALIMSMPADRHKTVKYIAALSTGISLFLSLVITFTYDKALGGMQFVETIPWIKDLGVNYALGVDGISIPMLLLTTLIGFSSVYASWNISERVKEFFVLLLILIAGVMGTFITTDLFIFFLFYEVVVIPIYLLVIMFRRHEVGFVFQFYNLISDLTAWENVELAASLVDDPLDSDEVLKQVGLTDRKDHFPAQLSGGEQQRISIARALVKKPSLLLCDEPTGALDLATGKTILELLKKANQLMGSTIIIVTHNTAIAQMADRVIRMGSGSIADIYNNESPVPPERIEW
jgi:ABC-type ATPase involved in cell division